MPRWRQLLLIFCIAMNRFAQKLTEHSILLRRARPEILQVNVGKLCNLTCVHCHVNAGPKRKEIMTRETIDRDASIGSQRPRFQLSILPVARRK